MKTESTPWGAMLSAASRLGVAPDHFWRLSVRDWRALIAGVAQEILPRAALQALMHRFPDHTHD